MSPADSSIETLVIFRGQRDRHSYFDDWLDAFVSSPNFRCTTADLRSRDGLSAVERLAPTAELIVVLHSAIGDSLREIMRCRAALTRRRGRLLAFVGNELNLPGALLSDKIALLKDLGAEYVATQLELDAGRWLYEETAARVLALPHALNPAVFRPVTPDDERDVDIGVRSFRYLSLLGDDDRNRLFDRFSEAAFDPPLVINIRTDERFDRAGWAAFLDRCRGTLSTEAGSLWLERDDRTLQRILHDLSQRHRPGLRVTAGSPAHRVARFLPAAVRRRLRRRMGGGVVQLESVVLEQLDFDEVYNRHFRDTPPAPVYGKCISSRHFDAIGTKTCQLMIRGRFNGILAADRHYLAIEPDLSNIDDIVRRFRDPAIRRSITTDAYELALDAHTYRHRTDAAYAALLAG